MHCVQCGAELVLGQQFCSKCGQRMAHVEATPSAAPYTPPAPAPTPRPANGLTFSRPSRVAKHLGTLAVLWIIYSVLRLIPGLGMMFFSHMRFPALVTPFPGIFHGPYWGPFLGAIGLGLSVIGMAGIIAGLGLMSRAPWARVLAIVLGCISLLHPPLGTALGIYTLWVLAPQDSCRDYESLARP